MEKMKGRREEKRESMLATLMLLFQQAMFGERVYMRTMHTQVITPSLLKLLNTRLDVMVRHMGTQLGLPPTSLLQALRGMVPLAVEFGHEGEGRDKLAMFTARHAHLPDVVIGDEEILGIETDRDMLQQGGGHGMWFEGFLAPIGAKDHMVPLREFAQLRVRQITTPVSVDATCNDTIVSMAGVDGQEAGLGDIMTGLDVTGETAEEKKAVHLIHPIQAQAILMEHGSAAA